MAPLTRGITRTQTRQIEETPPKKRKSRARRPQTKEEPLEQKKTRGRKLQPQPKETSTTSRMKWEMVEESDEEGQFSSDEPPTPDREDVINDAKNLAEELRITSAHAFEDLNTFLINEGLSGEQPYKEALHHLFDPKSTVMISKIQRIRISEQIGEYILLMLNHIFNFLIKLLYEPHLDGEIAKILLEAIEEVPGHIVVEIPELDEIISYAKDVSSASEIWQVSNGKVLRDRILRWRWSTYHLKETIAEWAQSPTRILKTFDKDYNDFYDKPSRFRMRSAY
ncbi:hypothetical protein FRX31_021789 [Thalictrum thalictroides]|uniref:Uncharacterized protein n=1 Tax=Thalictrum thalictroides TaxID=46969 RepID=A0A7J6VWR0_THATH|nr:hypothetical protein FRX31_021789 [Thalictrum thalictroides]